MGDSYDDYESGTSTGRYMRANEPSWVGPCFTCGTRGSGVSVYRGGGTYCDKHAPVIDLLGTDSDTKSRPSEAQSVNRKPGL